MNEIDLETADREQAQARITAIARAEYEAANGGRPFTGEIQVLPETEPSRYRHVATQPPVAAYQKNSEASYEAYARTAVTRAGAEHQVDPKAAALVFPDASLDGQIDSVDVGAPRQVPEAISRAIETVRADIAALSTRYREPPLSDEAAEMFGTAEHALAALDEIETALSGALVASFRWEPVQDPPLPASPEEIERAFEVVRTGINGLSEDIRDELNVPEARQEAKAAIFALGELEAVLRIYSAAIETRRGLSMTSPRPGYWLGKPLVDGLEAGPLRVNEWCAGQWRVILRSDSSIAESDEDLCIVNGTAETVDERTRMWLASLANLRAE